MSQLPMSSLVQPPFAVNASRSRRQYLSSRTSLAPRGLSWLACLTLATGLATLCVDANRAAAADKLEFNRDIRPILAEHCLQCHGPDKLQRKGDLRLDEREAAVASGAIVPGKPDQSEIIRRMFSADPDETMPPKSRRPMPDDQKQLLKRWVEQGAEYQLHWAFLAPSRPQPPAVKNEAWVKTPIDRFILSKLEQAGLEPAPEADRRTLARRLSLDLTGLPPAPADVEAFVNDQSADAYEKYVDSLLKSPAWGEHRGRYWLDVARYADTHGIHFDNYREIWAYRDWVIRAFNENMPFDQFTTEQLAGDLLPNRTLDQQIASGFNRCNITTSEGGTIPEEYLVLYTRDRTETVSQVWLGLTANCSVCHDHKFDPLSQKQFYELAAFFNNTTQPAMDGNRKDTPPIITVPLVDDTPRFEVIRRELPDVAGKRDARKAAARADFNTWLTSASAEQIAAHIPREKLVFHAPLSEGMGASTSVSGPSGAQTVNIGGEVVWDEGFLAGKAWKSRPDSSLAVADAGNFERDQPFAFGAWVYLPDNKVTGSLLARMDDGHDFRGWDLWIEQGKVGAHIIHKWPDDALKVVAGDPLPANRWTHVMVTYDGSSKAAGVKIYVDGVAQEKRNVSSDKLRSSIVTTVPLKLAQRDTTSRLVDLRVQDARIYAQALSGVEVARLAKGTRAIALVARPADKRAEAETNELFDWWLLTLDGEYRKLADQVAALEAEEAAIKARGTIAHVMQERGDEAMAYVLFRGEYDQRRDPVKPNTPAILPAFPAEAPRNRLGFAQWLLRPDHPLTARVTVNRYWLELFGNGIVRTAGDFGAAGEVPSHPELLDWLAVDFRESGWDIKRMYKLLVMSATYRQAAATTPLKLEKDPANRLLSRGPRFRMDGEMIRDYALAASGLLVRKLGGPSVKPYQPEGVWEAVAMIGSNTRDYRRDSGENLYRRSLYTFWKRSAPPASLEVFNAPNRETCVVRRERTNTPLQALVTLNDVQFVEAARHMAQRTLKEGGATDAERIDFIARRLLSRPLSTAELSIVSGSAKELRDFYAGHEEDARQLIAVGESKADPSLAPGELAAWTMLVNELFNLDEVLNK
ncbi:MAG: DUF1553 domain-containing protein [Pirellulales bacterium]